MHPCPCQPIRDHPTTQGNVSLHFAHPRRAFVADPTTALLEALASSKARRHLLYCQVSSLGPNLRCPRRSLPSSRPPCNGGARRCPARLDDAPTSSSSGFFVRYVAIRWTSRPAVCAGTAASCGVHGTHRSTTCTARAPGGSTGGERASSVRGVLVEAADGASLCGRREAARRAGRRRAGSGSDRSGLPGAGSVCPARTHLAGESALA